MNKILYYLKLKFWIWYWYRGEACAHGNYAPEKEFIILSKNALYDILHTPEDIPIKFLYVSYLLELEDCCYRASLLEKFKYTIKKPEKSSILFTIPSRFIFNIPIKYKKR